jgi:ferredoxin
MLKFPRQQKPGPKQFGGMYTMSLKISEECINCGACQPECPNEAVYGSGEDYELNGKTFPALSQEFSYIVPEKCTECVGFDSDPKCVSVCPTDACVKDVAESKEDLLKKAKALHPDKAF